MFCVEETDNRIKLSIKKGDVYSMPGYLAELDGERITVKVKEVYSNFVLFVTSNGIRFSLMNDIVAAGEKVGIRKEKSCIQEPTKIMAENIASAFRS